MAPTLLPTPLAALALRLCLLMATRALDTVERGAPEVTCSQGLTDCTVSPAPLCVASSESVLVADVRPRVVLCCASGCEPCLQVNITLRVDTGRTFVDEEASSEKLEAAEGSGHKPAGVVGVCLSSPMMHELTWRIDFTSGSHQPSPPATHEVQLLVKVRFDMTVVVVVSQHRTRSSHNRTVTAPSLGQVCPQHRERVKECDDVAPGLKVEPGSGRERLRLEPLGRQPQRAEPMCLMFWNDSRQVAIAWPRGETETSISSDVVVPCLCFQVWWKGKADRKQVCPFTERQDARERMRNNVSVTLARSAAADADTGLSWNVTAPCRLEAELWLCKRDAAGGECEEVRGSRRKLHSPGAWRPTHGGHVSQVGEFSAAAHPLLCLQVKINASYLEPHCPFAASRWRWGLPVLLGLLLMCVAVLAAYFVQGVLKGYVWRWLKEDDVKGAVGGGHVVLLYPPDDDGALPGLMCHLGSSLRALGFSVSLDLWSQAELGALGPVPWLHSRLDQLKRQGGKVVLVLTQTAWIRAEEWGAHGCAKKNRDVEEDGVQASVDVFSASLSCVLADYLQGRAGERFTLVQFESLPPEPPGGFRALPELFRGLHLYSLPSQSLGFLTELAGARRAATASARRKRAGGLRMASRALASGLSSFTAGTGVLRLAGVSPGSGDCGETVPLQPCILTPPSSPDASPKLSEVVWL